MQKCFLSVRENGLHDLHSLSKAATSDHQAYLRSQLSFFCFQIVNFGLLALVLLEAKDSAMIIDVIQSAPWWTYPNLAMILLFYLTRRFASEEQESQERTQVLAAVKTRMA